jgi:hypothetical protein
MFSSNFCTDLTLPKYDELNSKYVHNNISECGACSENIRAQTPTLTTWDGIVSTDEVIYNSYDITDTIQYGKTCSYISIGVEYSTYLGFLFV